MLGVVVVLVVVLVALVVVLVVPVAVLEVDCGLLSQPDRVVTTFVPPTQYLEFISSRVTTLPEEIGCKRGDILNDILLPDPPLHRDTTNVDSSIAQLFLSSRSGQPYGKQPYLVA